MRRVQRFRRHDTGGRPLWVWVTLLALASLGLGISLGRATVDASSSRAPQAASPTPTIPAPESALSSPFRVVNGVPEGYPETAAGAIAAAVAFLHVEVGDLMARPDAYRVAWQQMCTPTYFTQSGRAAAETMLTNQESANHLLSDAAAGQTVYEHIFPLTAAVLGAAGPAITVQTWSLVVAHPGDGPTTVTFSAGTLVLRWWNGDWRLDGGSASSTASDGASGSMRLDDGPGLPRYLAQMRGVDDAPTH